MDPALQVIKITTHLQAVKVICPAISVVLLTSDIRAVFEWCVPSLYPELTQV